MENNRAIISTALDALYNIYRRGNFFMIPNCKEKDVRSNIIGAVKEKAPSLNVDIYMFTSQMENDVMIKI